MILSGVNFVCAYISVCIGLFAIISHLKNYRKPIDQRPVVRILCMVPLFAINSFAQLYLPKWAAFVCNFICEFYEAFVIYAFYTLLTNLLGGERQIIYSTTGRAPVHIWMFKIDISDPETYIALKRMIMQFVYIRPAITIAMFLFRRPVLKLLITILYNISITFALQALTVFYVCLKGDLAPFRVVTKFLSIKSVVFFSYWQSLLMAIFSHFGLFTSNLKTIQYSILCIESVPIAYLHYTAFSCNDYTATMRFGFARMRCYAAFHDVFGTQDLKHDFLKTFIWNKYSTRDFDSVEAVLDHPDSRMRGKRIAAGLRYKYGGQCKYWLPKASLARLLTPESRGLYGTEPISTSQFENTPSHRSNNSRYNGDDAYSGDDLGDDDNFEESQKLTISDERDYLEDEELYEKARRSYGDYNYPVITVRESEQYISFQDRLDRNMILGYFESV